MHPYLQPRADELNEKLEAVLKEFGLRTRLTYVGGYPRFVFEAPRKTGFSKPFSPVAVEFDPKSLTKLAEAPWLGAYVALADWDMRPLGDTGWSHRRLWQTTSYMIRSFGDYVFDEIEGYIRERGIVRLEAPGQDWIVDSEELADAVIEIGSGIHDLGIVRIQDSKGGATEAITFQDSEWRRVHMIFPSGHGEILVDGEFTGRFSTSDARSVSHLAFDLSRGREPGRELWDRPQSCMPFGNR